MFDDAPSGLRSGDPQTVGAPAAAAEPVPELPRSPAARRALAYEARKRELSEAWLAPRRVPSPWEQPTQTPMQPQTFAEPFLDPVETVTLPAAINRSKGGGSLTPQEIEKVRADERAAFAQRLEQQWRWNIAHL
jgi:hypothetical protein